MAFDLNMDNSLAPTTEKSHHLLYLRDFRTQQCPLFLQHKCTQHRPYTCFHWHFQNQKRRRVIRRDDGTFNYCATEYCNKYNEATGVCADGDDCMALHKPANDVERKYHLRFYKTSTCIYETDAKGHCVRNGSHCPYAHGASDLRQPVIDIRELSTFRSRIPSISSSFQAAMSGDQTANSELQPNSPAVRCLELLEREMSLSLIEPKWNDIVFVLLYYKTETCAKPPRLCRQGYACPYSHNQKDRRRSPLNFRYRSTPCPNVKHGDEWGDPGLCRQEDLCQYCHTRTEQQFHHEIFKSTKCNDMLQTGFCPRGPFCAFAHVPEEITIARAGLMNLFSSSNLAQYVKNPSQTASLMGALDHSSGAAAGPVSPTPPSPPCSSSASTGQKRDTNNNHSANAAANGASHSNAAVIQPAGVSDSSFGNAAYDSQHYGQASASSATTCAWQLGRSRLNSITEEQLLANLIAGLQPASSSRGGEPFSPGPMSNESAFNPLLHSYPGSAGRNSTHERFHSVGCERPSYESSWPSDESNGRMCDPAPGQGAPAQMQSRFDEGDALAQQFASSIRMRHFSGPAYVRQLSGGANNGSSNAPGQAPTGIPPSAFAFAGLPHYATRTDSGVMSAERRGSSEQDALASAGDTVESVIGSALEDPSDLRFGELSIGNDFDVVEAQKRSMFPPMQGIGDGHSHAFSYGLQVQPFNHPASLGDASLAKQPPACGLVAYCSYEDQPPTDTRRYSDARRNSELCMGTDPNGMHHLATSDLLQLQEQRIFGANGIDDNILFSQTRGNNWS